MNKYYSKYSKKDNYSNRQYNHRNTYHYKRNAYNNNYIPYYKRKKINYDLYEEDISYEKEATLSTKAPSTKDGSFSQSSNQNSRRQSICDNNDNIENNKDSSLFIKDNNNLEKSKIENIPKINLSENELKTAYFKPKNYEENSISKKENNIIQKDENIAILEINVKISKDKAILFKLRKYDDMFKVIQEACQENEISEEYTKFFAYIIIKALNSIYGIYNLKLKEEEIKYLSFLKEKYEDE